MKLLTESTDTNDTSSSTCGTVFLLPIELQEYVTKVQRRQQEMLSLLKR
jgi:hypothetical protein